jgi:hypothetical protein
MDEDAADWAAYGADGSDTDESNIGDDEAAMWAAYSVDSSINYVDDDGDEDDEYDEDTDIEDALGIGYY